MKTATITIRLDAEAVRAFRAVPAQERKKLEALLSVWLLEATRTGESLTDIMRETSRNAQKRGLTPAILESMLREVS